MNLVMSGDSSMSMSPDLLGSLKTLGDGRLGQFSSTSLHGPAGQEPSHVGISLQSIAVDSP